MWNIFNSISRTTKIFIVGILYVFGRLIDYYISNHKDQADFWIRFLNNSINIKLIWGIFAFIVMTILITEIWHLITQHYKEKILEKQQEIDEKNRMLEMKTGALVTKLKDLFYFYEKEILFNHLKKLTDKKSFIHSAQVYTYSKNINTHETTIKISYVNGYAYEDIDINAMIQNYYTIPNDIYFFINNILEKTKKLDLIESKKNLSELNINFQTEEAIKNELENQIDQFINQYVPSIVSKSKSDLNDLDSILLSMLELLYEINLKISNESNKNEVYSINIFDDEYDNLVLRSIKRTGILVGILKVNEHVFMNSGYSRKKGRIYITRCFELNGKDYIVLFSLYPNIIEFPKWKELVSDISLDFINNLKNEIDEIYDSDREEKIL